MNTIAQGGVLDKLKDVQGQIAPNIPVDASIGELLSATNIITFIFFLAGAIFLFNLLQAAWTYVTATGDPKKIAEATQRILNAFFGIVIVLASFVIIRIVLAILGLPGLI
ncbi:MAG: hypothetical protein AAB973_01505 [Patescibacteria group bacterium]